MTLALLVESPTEQMDGLPTTKQTLIFPYQGEVHIYHRASNGMKGRGQVWKRLPTPSDLPTEIITAEPVAIVLAERDLDMVGLGVVTNIAVKALYALESANPTTAPITHKDMVTNLIQRLTAGDTSLSAYITDKRRTNDITIEPLGVIPTIADTVVEADRAMMDMITVPDPKWSKQYINRKINGVLDFDILDHALANGHNVLIEGGAGSGKTICVQAYASARGYRYFNFSSNQGADPAQFFGRWIPRADGQGYRWQDGAITQLVRHGGVLLLNEVNFLPERISTVLYSLLDYRREIQLLENGGEVIKAHKNLLIVADMNAGYRGTHELSQAWNDRYTIKLEFPYDRNIEMKVVGNRSLLALADKLRDQYDKEELTTPISTRSLVSFMANANRFGVDFAITSFINGFNKEERGGVKLACTAFRDNILNDMKVVIHPEQDTFVTENI